MVCAYGYSTTCFLFALLGCFVPFGVLQWILLGYALVNSTLFLIVSLHKHIEGLNAKKVVASCVIGAFQLLLCLCIKLIFLKLDPASVDVPVPVPVPAPVDAGNSTLLLL